MIGSAYDMASSERRSILKQGVGGTSAKRAMWDEGNLAANEVVKAELNPTKIDEPKTPYHAPAGVADDGVRAYCFDRRACDKSEPLTSITVCAWLQQGGSRHGAHQQPPSDLWECVQRHSKTSIMRLMPQLHGTPPVTWLLTRHVHSCAAAAADQLLESAWSTSCPDLNTGGAAMYLANV